jgi:hypothetical protein
MSSFPGSPRLIKGGLVLLDPVSGGLLRVISLQYNPDTLTRSLAPQGVGGEGPTRSEPLRFKAPPVETIKLEAEIDATDQLEFPDQNPITVQSGIQPQLAALETIVYPTVDQLQLNDTLASAGTLEIAPMLAPLILFVWSSSRVVPVRITEFSVLEEAFDPNLNPIRAKITLSLRVLNVYDVGFGGKIGSLYMSYQQQKENLAAKAPPSSFASLGLQNLP